MSRRSCAHASKPAEYSASPSTTPTKSSTARHRTCLPVIQKRESRDLPEHHRQRLEPRQARRLRTATLSMRTTAGQRGAGPGERDGNSPGFAIRPRMHRPLGQASSQQRRGVSADCRESRGPEAGRGPDPTWATLSAVYDAAGPARAGQCFRTTCSGSPGLQIVTSMWPPPTSTADAPMTSAA